MKLPKKLNTLLVDDLGTRLEKVQDCLLVGCDGLPASQAFALRTKLRAGGSRMRVVKNTLARVAFDKAGLKTLIPQLGGASAVLYGNDGAADAILAISKVVTEWNKDKAVKPLTVKGGVMGRVAIAAKDVERLASIPAKPVLMAQLAGAINGPARSIAGGVAGVSRKLAVALNAVAEQKQKAGAAAA